jgi:membrane-associated protein
MDMIPGFDLSSFAATAGPWAAILIVALILFAESGLLIGFFLPGDSILFTVGFLIQGGLHLPFNIFVAVFIFFIAAALGDSVGYTFGNRVGRRLFARKESFLFKQANIKRAEEFYNKYGGKTIIVARFIPIIRTFAPIVAGIGNMKYTMFLMFNLIGAFLWASGVTFLGFFAGKWFESMGIQIDDVILPIVLVIIVISILPPLIHIFKDKKRRDAFLKSFKRRIPALFKK